MKTIQTKPELKLVGEDGNSFMILGLARKAASKAGWTAEEWDKVRTEATSGDRDHLILIIMEHFDVS